MDLFGGTYFFELLMFLIMLLLKNSTFISSYNVKTLLKLYINIIVIRNSKCLVWLMSNSIVKIQQSKDILF